MFEQFIDGKWVYVGYSTQLRNGYKARRHQEFRLIDLLVGE